MKILKNALLLGTGLTVGFFGGCTLFAFASTYRVWNPIMDKDRVIFDANGSRVVIINGQEDGEFHFAAWAKKPQDET